MLKHRQPAGARCQCVTHSYEAWQSSTQRHVQSCMRCCAQARSAAMKSLLKDGRRPSNSMLNDSSRRSSGASERLEGILKSFRRPSAEPVAPWPVGASRPQSELPSAICWLARRIPAGVKSVARSALWWYCLCSPPPAREQTRREDSSRLRGHK